MDRSIARLIERYIPLIDATEVEQFIHAVTREVPPAIRLNPLKIDVEEAIRSWQEYYGWELRQVPFCPEGWQFVQDAENISWTAEHRMGFYYIQEAASMLPVEMFDFAEKKPSLVLDMAAAPGGKTTHLVSRLNDEGLILANDSNTQRVPSLQGNLQRWGAFSAAITNFPGERFGGWFPEMFDCVLLDAPCSGEALRTGDRHKGRMISQQERATLHQRQVRLLNSAFQVLRPGGQIVYATCSLAPEEDEAVVDALLQMYPQQVSIEAVDHLLPIPAPGSVLNGEHEYNSAVRRAVRLWPHLYDTSGFFAALIRKNDSVSSKPDTPPQRPFAKAGYKLLTRQEQDGLQAYLQEVYGFDLGAVIERRGLTLWKSGQFISAIPELWLSRFAECPFVAVGMTLGKQSRKEFTPSHELISRFSAGFTRRRVTLNEKQVNAWLAEQNLKKISTPLSSGELVLLENSDHLFLGRGRVEGDEIKNMLPRWL